MLLIRYSSEGLYYPTSKSLPIVFFQAVDGIRVGHVTGVQTCALPIYPGSGGRLAPWAWCGRHEGATWTLGAARDGSSPLVPACGRWGCPSGTSASCRPPPSAS